MDYPARLQEVADQFVSPFYGQMLHGNCLRLKTRDRDVWIKELRDAAQLLDQPTAELYLETLEWRGQMAVAWMVGMRGWHQFTGQLGARLVASELTYAGQGLCVGLSLLGTPQATDQLCRYLDRWLPETECFYDQHWAMAALVEVDKQSGENRAAAYDNAFATWASSFSTQVDLAPVGEILKLLSGAPQSARRRLFRRQRR